MKKNKLTLSALSLALSASAMLGSVAPVAAAEDVEAAAAQTAQNLSGNAEAQSAATAPSVDLAYFGENLALGKTAVASSREAASVDASYVTDGTSQHWGSARGTGPDWIYVDLGEVKEIGLINVWWESTKADNYKVQVAETLTDDDSCWTDIEVSETWPTYVKQYFELETPVNARYVRVYIGSYSADEHVSTGINSWNTIGIREIEVYGKKNMDLQLDNVNVALNKTASADSVKDDADHLVAGMAFDGNKTSTRWSSAYTDAPHWLAVDLGQTYNVKTIKITWEMRKANNYEIQLSDDGETWTTVWSRDTYPASVNDKIVLDKVYQAQYVRLYINSFTEDDPDGGVSWKTVSVYEMEVYGGDLTSSLSTPAEAAAAITANPVSEGDTTVTVNIPEDTNYEYELRGADLEQIVDNKLNIYQPLVEKTVNLAYKVTDPESGDYALADVPVVIPGKYSVTENDQAAPVILPELQEWKGSEQAGKFAITEASTIYYAEDEFSYAAQELVNDYEEMTGKKLAAVKASAPELEAGDIFFTKVSGTGLGDEGYTMNITDSISITAEHSTGAYWATRTILQALQTEGEISMGEARDYPLYETRGLILDVGRKTFTMDFLQKMAKAMAWYKLNDFQIHLNDNYIFLENYTKDGRDPMTAYSGFRLESDITKGKQYTLADGSVVEAQADLTSKDVYYTKDEFRSFIQESRKMGMNIVPEFDTPAHSLALTKVRPDLKVGSSGRQNDHLDLANKYDDCLSFVQSIFDEYMTGENPVFDEDTIVHIGADEFESSSQAFRKFINDMNKYVSSTGRTARVWGSLTQLSQGDYVDGTGMEINLWNSGWADMKEMYDLGFDLINCNDGLFYIVPNATYYYDYLNDGTCYNYNINKIGSTTIPAGDPQMIGAAFAIWNDMIDEKDNGMSEYDIYDRFINSAGLFAANLWGKGDLNVTDAKALTKTLNDVPGVDFDYTVEANEEGQVAQILMDSAKDASGNGHDLVLGMNASIEDVDYKKALKLEGGESYAELEGLSTVGLNHNLRVKVKRTSESTDEQILFESEYGSIKAVQNGTGKVGITRENMDYSFDYELPVGKWVELEFKNEFETTSLYVNGELVDTIGGHVRGNMKATCMLPVATVGSKTNSFIGYVDDIRIDEASTFNSTMKLDDLVITAKSIGKTTAELDAAVAQAEAVIAKFNPTAEEIDGAIDALNNSLSKIDYARADYSWINELIGRVPANMSLFTDASANRVRQAVASVAYNLPEGRQADVDAAYEVLETALAELELKDTSSLGLIDQSTISILGSSSEETEGEDGHAINVLDGSTSTFWHSRWSSPAATGPHWLSFDFGSVKTISEVIYTPRTDSANGRMLGYTVSVSEDGETWTDVKSGSVANDTTVKTITLDTPVATQYIKLTLTQVTTAGDWGTCAEMNFREVTAADTEGLEAAIEAAEAIDADNYSEETYAALTTALEAAEAVLANESATAAEVFEAEGNLYKAIASLKATAIDGEVTSTEVLDIIIRLTQDVDLDKYVLNGQDEFKEALAHAQAVLAKPKSDAQVQEAAQRLNTAWLNLRFKADEDMLRRLAEALETLESADRTLYSAKALAAMDETISQIKAALNDPANLEATTAELLAKKAGDIKALEDASASITPDTSISSGTTTDKVEADDVVNDKVDITEGVTNVEDVISAVEKEESVTPAVSAAEEKVSTAADEKKVSSSTAKSVKTSAAMNAGGWAAAAGAAAMALLAALRRNSRKG